LRGDRRSTKLRPIKPSSIIAQVEGSGTDTVTVGPMAEKFSEVEITVKQVVAVIQ
jgi:hypothetical protein